MPSEFDNLASPTPGGKKSGFRPRALRSHPKGWTPHFGEKTMRAWLAQWMLMACGAAPAAGMLLSFYTLAYADADAPGVLASVHRVGAHPAVFVGLLQMAFFFVQTLFCLRYRPFGVLIHTPLPTLSVLIPAYNEGAEVEACVHSVAKAGYPHHLLQIICVDDGSHDDTAAYLARAQQAMAHLVTVRKLPHNCGKRAALHTALQLARGEIVVTLDSDSQLQAQALLHLVQPFLHSSQVGAVAGRVAVLRPRGLLARMLEVQYALAFDFVRAAQSTNRTVICCPGALTAIRRSLIVPHADAWLRATFLGRPINHGEDQALTNIVLGAGYQTVYQRTAAVHTLVPSRYLLLCRMLTRWDRSSIVEGIFFIRHVAGKLLRQRRVLPVVGFLMDNLCRIAFYIGLCELPWLLLEKPGLARGFCLASLLAATSSALYYLRSERSFRFIYGVVYAFYAFFLLSWTLPWALLTIRDSRWGTR